MESEQIVEETKLDKVKSEVPAPIQTETESEQTIEETKLDKVKSEVSASTQIDTESQQTVEETELDKVKSEVPTPIKNKIQQIVEEIELDQLKSELPVISIGDTVKVGVLIQEGNKQRVQPYEGTLIAQHRAGMNSTITVRRIFQGVGVERVFTLHSPSLKNIEITRRAKVRKAKLYYLRDRVGKATRLKQKNITNN